MTNTRNVTILAIITIITIAILGVATVQTTGLFSLENTNTNETIKIGWISDISGPVAKYGAYEAGIMAVEEINANGGINGKQIELIVEDGKCNPKEAVNAVKKLLEVDQVKFVLGGHCTPESAAIAPFVEEKKVIMLASITTSPVLTNMGEYIFRTSPVSIRQSDMMADLAYNDLEYTKMAIIYEQTDYARPIAQRMEERFLEEGGQVTSIDGYLPGTTDFKTIISKATAGNPEAVFISAQSPEAAFQILKQIKELGLNAQLFGNDAAANKGAFVNDPELQEGMISAGPVFDLSMPKIKAFNDKYKDKYGALPPYGFFTNESYDAVYILKESIEAVGEDPEKVKDYLYTIDFDGASGKINLDEHGDGIREYTLKIVKDGALVPYEAA